jgi:hypothetical protein
LACNTIDANEYIELVNQQEQATTTAAIVPRVPTRKPSRNRRKAKHKLLPYSAPRKEHPTGTNPAARRSTSHLNAQSDRDYQSYKLEQRSQQRTDTSTTAKKENTTNSLPLTGRNTVTT